MFGEMFRNFFAVLLTGMVIKIMDDYLDKEYDALISKATLAKALDTACLPYALLAFTLALNLNLPWSSSLFLASYAIGMGHDLSRKLPSGIKGYQEATMAIGGGIFLLGWQEMVSSFGIILAVQLIDDLYDLREDQESNQNNLVHRWERVTAFTVLLICFILGCWLALFKTCFVLISIPLINFLFSYLARRVE